VAELIRQHPKIDGRFEGGFLLADRLVEFVDFEPYAGNVQRFWNISEADLAYVCQAESWQECYQRLAERSDIPGKEVCIYDKTPIYMRYLNTVLSKVDVPVICMVRDPRAVYWSQKKRWPEFGGDIHSQNTPTDMKRQSTETGLVNRLKMFALSIKRQWNFLGNYLAYAQGWQQANRIFHDRILLVQFEQLCTNPSEEAQRIYNFLGLAFQESYLALSETSNQYVARNGISVDVVGEYRSHLSRWEQRYILLATQAFTGWHWHSNSK